MRSSRRLAYPWRRDSGFTIAGLSKRVVETLLERWRNEMGNGTTQEKICQGTLLSRTQYLSDTELWGYEDARLEPRGTMTAEQITHWTVASK
jgi:hypothetical protein